MNQFSHWVKWDDRSTLEGCKFPGIYALVISSQNISGEPFSFRKDIVYFGMTNSVGGLRSRLNQFDRTIKGGTGHGGAMRVRFKHVKHSNHATLMRKLFVAVSYTKCSPKQRTPKDLLLMGNVAKQEYECLAEYRKLFLKEPQFNDMESPKK